MTYLPTSGFARPRSGSQHLLALGRYRAVIGSVGATLRALTHDGRPLVATFDEDEIRPMSRGALLAPWPNRLEDGSYSFAGRQLRAPITEPGRNNALHGFVSWHDWHLTRSTTSSVTLETRLVPIAAYPFDVLMHATYELTAAGLTCTVTARNVGADAAPYGLGAHPYLVAGPSGLDTWTLTMPAATHLVVDDRMLPRSTEPVTVRPDLDFRSAREIGSAVIDDGFTGLSADSHGFTATVTDPTGTGTTISWDPDVLPWAQLYTSDKPATPAHRAGLAIEPMTCPANALRSGDGLIVLQPQDTHTASWRLAALEAAG